MARRPSVAGLNHVTLAVVDLDLSLVFYDDLLGMTLKARWAEGAYLSAESLWLCLSVDPAAGQSRPHSDKTHVAFDVAAQDFEALAACVRAVAPLWRDNTSEGASLYVLDPDGHKLELHVGSLDTRLAHYRVHPRTGRWIAPGLDDA